MTRPHRKKRTFNMGIFQHIQLWKRSSPILNFQGPDMITYSTYQNLSLRPFHKWFHSPQSATEKQKWLLLPKPTCFQNLPKKTESSQSYPNRTLEQLKWRLNHLPTPKFFNHHPIRGVSRHLHVLCGVDSPRWRWHRKKIPKKNPRWIKWTYLGKHRKVPFLLRQLGLLVLRVLELMEN